MGVADKMNQPQLYNRMIIIAAMLVVFSCALARAMFG